MTAALRPWLTDTSITKVMHSASEDLVAFKVACVALPACKKAKIVAPDYSRQLPPGAHALRKITDPTQLPDLTQAFSAKDNDLLTAL